MQIVRIETYRELPDDYICPHCGQEMEWNYYANDKFTVVGETNGNPDYNGNEEVVKCLTAECGKCGKL